MTLGFHCLQATPSSCVRAALVSALRACGLEASEDDLSPYVGSDLFDVLWGRFNAERLEKERLKKGCVNKNCPQKDCAKIQCPSKLPSCWVEVPWLGAGMRFNRDDPSYKHMLSMALRDGDVVCAVLEVPLRPWLVFAEGCGLRSPYGAGREVGHNHAVVLFGAGRDRASLLDPWSYPEGQPLGLSLDEVLGLAPVGTLIVERAKVRLPSEPSDRI